jgi:hypothetical protein
LESNGKRLRLCRKWNTKVRRPTLSDFVAWIILK